MSTPWLIYIAGPINGYPDGNKRAFHEAESQLRIRGYATINPHTIPILSSPHICKGAPIDGSSHRYGCVMIPDLHALLECDGYTLLPGWEKSPGAVVEKAVADICGKVYVEL